MTTPFQVNPFSTLRHSAYASPVRDLTAVQKTTHAECGCCQRLFAGVLTAVQSAIVPLTTMDSCGDCGLSLRRVPCFETPCGRHALALAWAGSVVA